ncbi:PKD domain-containing protein [Methanosarcina sp. Z-7115]|uniref:PKD domain-containing protein n=1 Tax=Methanosarcina baikalica TaxID=3073890 RepID=A0ABU2D5K1_9EURY|nr:PKD domain-containing protein [Methanosarcina sp. Z-7115]MCO5382660.1 PKD domain-containing protein [Methanosarcina sp. ERenArc_MAG2]MDR7667266.1 PKD domain-containing protein [Methanosarcina sp. Z-7115]
MKEIKSDEARRVYSLIGVLGITVLAFLMLVSIAGAAPYAYIPNLVDNNVSAVDTAAPKITETQITTSGQADRPAIYGDRIVWEDWRNGNGDIYLYNLSTHKETQITANESDQMLPAIYDNIVVWVDGRNNYGYDIYMYDLSTKTEKKITGLAWWPDIYGNRIVWERGWERGCNIFMYDLSTKKETQITPNGSDRHFPAIYGNRIVWDDNRHENWDIYMYDLSTSKETQITTNKLDQRKPAIYGDRIAWEDSRDRYLTIYMYDLSTKKEIRVNTSTIAFDPAIYGDKIVWTSRTGDDDDIKHDIYMYDLSASKETQITPNGHSEYPDIYGNRIVWKEQNYYGDTNIYMATISEEPKPRLPVANFSNNVTLGYVPLSVQFTDLSQNAISWYWNFGDGNNSTEQNPMYTYYTVGEYTVNLTASNANGTDSKLATITVLEHPVLPVAIFSAKPTSGKAPLNVVFTDESTGAPTSWKWTFGDGAKSSVQNPTHKYSKVGSYKVTLTATNTEGSNTTTKTDYIKVIEKPVAKFTSNVTSGKAPLTVAFTDKSTGIPTKWKWIFGDGAKSSDQNPIHQYSQEGKYKVTLTVINAAGSSTTTKTNYIKVTTNTRPGIYSKSK